ncbi:MAG: class I SAM-dependent methyltransferase [Planctomycetes bacterium]|nr:class I SAM-dependent methyltransferase [Planctomycetota bacterium]
MSHDDHVVHDTDFERVRQNLDGLYGTVAALQNAEIASRIVGTRVLDVGAGAGKLARDLSDQGFQVTAIDIDPRAVAFAREVTGVEVLPRSVYETGFPDRSFDAVVFRESVFHLDFERVLVEVERICGRQVVIFESNSPNPLLRLGRKLIGHEEHDERPPEYYAGALAAHGYVVTGPTYLDACLIPLSGGLLTRPLPLAERASGFLLRLDAAVTGVAARAGLDRTLCWRYLLSGVKAR